MVASQLSEKHCKRPDQKTSIIYLWKISYCQPPHWHYQQSKVFHFYGIVEKSDGKYLKGDGTWKHRVSRYYLVGWHKLIENVISVVTTPAKMVRFTEWKIRNIYSNTVFFHRNFIFIEFYRKEFAIKPNKFYLCPLRSYLELPSARYIRGGHFWPLFSDSVFWVLSAVRIYRNISTILVTTICRY